MKNDHPKIRIENTTGVGRQTKITVDGKPIRFISADISIRHDEFVTARIEVVVDEIDAAVLEALHGTLVPSQDPETIPDDIVKDYETAHYLETDGGNTVDILHALCDYNGDECEFTLWLQNDKTMELQKNHEYVVEGKGGTFVITSKRKKRAKK